MHLLTWLIELLGKSSALIQCIAVSAASLYSRYLSVDNNGVKYILWFQIIYSLLKHTLGYVGNAPETEGWERNQKPGLL